MARVVPVRAKIMDMAITNMPLTVTGAAAAAPAGSSTMASCASWSWP